MSMLTAVHLRWRWLQSWGWEPPGHHSMAVSKWGLSMKCFAVLIVIAVAGCGPNYESGKTECSDKNECPSGFHCGTSSTSTTKVCFSNLADSGAVGAGGATRRDGGVGAGGTGGVQTTIMGSGGSSIGKTTSTGGTIGSTGGTRGTGGSAGTGGMAGPDAASATGGAPGTGGIPGMGGTGGHAGNGGSAATGGVKGTGGVVVPDGGRDSGLDASTSKICTPNAMFCSAGAVRLCSIDGLTSSLYQTCSSSQYCDATSASCKAQVCTPNQPACNLTTATVCNTDGSGYQAGGVDCSNSGQVCVSGTCKALACVPSAKFCSAGTVRQCSTDGSTSTLYQTCSSTQYCDTATGTCKAQLCTPNQPACDANSSTICNADGSGYAGPAQSCGALYCVAGTCQTAMFKEDFEDGNFDGWQVGATTYTRSVTTSTAAAGTTHSLVQTGGGTNQTGLYYTFPNLKPTHVGWWVMQTVTTMNGSYFVLSSGSSSNYVAWVYLRDSGNIRIYDTDSQIAETSYLANTWYHIEMRNINWTTQVFDFYVNNVLVSAAFPFRSSTAVDITRLDIYNFGTGTAYWDEIVFD